MNRIERMQERNNAWLRRTGFCFGKVRANNAPISQKAWEHMRSKPYDIKKPAEKKVVV